MFTCEDRVFNSSAATIYFLYTDYMFIYIFCQWLTEDFLKLTNIGRHHLFLLCHKLHDASSVLGDLCFHLKMLIIQKPIMRV